MKRHRSQLGRMVPCALVVGLSLGIADTAVGARVAFDFNIVDAPGLGFNDPVLGPQRLAAFEQAAENWGRLLEGSYAGETIHVDLTMVNPFGGLATASSAKIYSNYSRLITNTWYPAAIANHEHQGDIEPDVPEFIVRFTPNLPWYYGTDGQPPANQYDFVTVAMHEIAHGLGFNSRMSDASGEYKAGSQVLSFGSIYDRFLIDDPVAGVLLSFQDVADRAAAIVSGNLYWAGQETFFANDGAWPKLWAPNPYQVGSSIAHLDGGAFPDMLMRANGESKLGEVVRPSVVELAMLSDMGWDIVPEPVTAVMAILCAIGGVLATMRARRPACRGR